MHLNNDIISFFYFVISLIVTNQHPWRSSFGFDLWFGNSLCQLSSFFGSLKQLELNLWAWQLPVTILILGGRPDVAELGGSQLLTVLGFGDVVVLAKVWNKVVSINSWDISDSKLMTEVILSPCEGGSVVEHILVCTEMWHEVVSWGIIWWTRGVQDVSECLLSIGDVLLGVCDLVVLTEMRHAVVHFEGVRLGSWSPGEKWLALQLNSAASRNQSQSG